MGSYGSYNSVVVYPVYQLSDLVSKKGPKAVPLYFYASIYCQVSEDSNMTLRAGWIHGPKTADAAS